MLNQKIYGFKLDRSPSSFWVSSYITAVTIKKLNFHIFLFYFQMIPLSITGIT